MYLPISDTLIKRMLTLGRVATLAEDCRILVPHSADVFLADNISKYINKDLKVSLNPYGKYDLILVYSPLPFNQEQLTAIEYYSMLKTNGRLICTALEATFKVKKDLQKRFGLWLQKVDPFIEDLPPFDMDKSKKGKLLIIDRLELIEKEAVKPGRVLRIEKYRQNKYYE